MTDLKRTTLQRALLPGYDAPLPLAEALQEEPDAQITSDGWSPERAHARLRLLAGAVGLSGVALILVLLITGAPTHG